MKVIYYANDWLFVDRVRVYIDGRVEGTISGRFDRDNNRNIWEWLDIKVETSQFELLKKISDGKEVILRFEGSTYRKDKTIGKSDKNAIRDVLLAFCAFTNNYDKKC